MRVLLVNDLAAEDPAAGGTERYVTRLAAALTEAGDKVELLAGSVTRRRAGRLLDLYDPRARQLVAHTAQAMRADVVHHHNVLRELSMAVLGAPPGTPSVLTVHDWRLLGGADPDAPVVRTLLDRATLPVLHRLVRHRTSRLLAVSEPLAAALRRTGFVGAHAVASPAPRPGAKPRALQDCRDVVFAGRLSADKGLPELLAAWDRIAASHPRSRCFVAGAGPLAADVRAEFTGQLTELELLLLVGRARVVVVPSRTDLRPEGTPLIALEAMACGRPLVATDADGLASLVSTAGVGVPPGDVGALAEAMALLLDDDDLAVRLGERGLRAATAHLPPAVAREHHDVYRAACSRSSP